MHREPEGGVRCQVLDFSASDEEVERSSTGSLSRGAVPKEAPGSLANRTFILVLRSFSLPLSLSLSFSFSLIFALFLLVGCSHLIRRYQRVPGRKTRIIESIVSHPPPRDSSADYKIIITRPPPSPLPPISFPLSSPAQAVTSRSTLNARLSH